MSQQKAKKKTAPTNVGTCDDKKKTANKNEEDNQHTHA